MKLGQGYIFTGVCDSVHRGGGLLPGGSALGGPGPGGSAPGWGGCLVQGCAWSGGAWSGGCLVETPLRWLLLRAVCILLECILVVTVSELLFSLLLSYFSNCTHKWLVSFLICLILSSLSFRSIFRKWLKYCGYMCKNRRMFLFCLSSVRNTLHRLAVGVTPTSPSPFGGGGGVSCYE